ncbi:MAG: short-chain dehydrogenase, partial [Myxococcota bacterium]
RRFAEQGSARKSVACHPGYSATNLFFVAPQLEGRRWLEGASRLANRYVAQSSTQGAWPTVLAATDEGAEGGEYYGPEGWFELKGRARAVKPSAHARDPETARRLWEVSEDLVGTKFFRD